MSRYNPPTVRVKKRNRALLPVLGLVLVICLAAIAYVIAPPLVQLAEDQSPKLATQFAQFRDDYGENSLDYVAAVLLWLIMSGLAVFVVSMFIGEDPDKESLKYMGPHPTDKKAMAKAYRRELKEREKRARQLKKQK